MSKSKILQSLRRRTGLGMDPFAKAIGFAGGSSYQKYETEGQYEDGYQLHFLKRLAKYMLGKGSPPIEMTDISLLLKKPPDLDDPGRRAMFYDLLGVELPQSLSGGSKIIGTCAGAIPIKGSAQSLFWAPIALSREEPTGMLPIPCMSTHPSDGQYALRLVGPSFTNVVPEGYYAICYIFEGSVEELEEGSKVHLERIRNNEVEWSLKTVSWGPKGLSLKTETDNPKYQEIISWNDSLSHGVELRIKGIVIGYFFPV